MTPWTVPCQASLSMGFSQASILEWVVISSSRGSSLPRDQTHVSCIGRWIIYHRATKEAPDTGIPRALYFNVKCFILAWSLCLFSSSSDLSPRSFLDYGSIGWCPNYLFCSILSYIFCDSWFLFLSSEVGTECPICANFYTFLSLFSYFVHA